MGSHFKERLWAPESRLLGMFVKFPTMETIEILASAGLDFVIIDMEHAPLSIDVVYRMLVTAELAGMSALVRLRGHEPATANMFFDAGASGVLIPHCSPYDTARELITDMLFPPHGRRGAGGGGRATRWGIDGSAEYRRGGESGVVRVPMIEDPAAVEDIERILEIPGVDAVFIGQGDLTQTLGDRAAAQKLVDRALAACVARGIPACTTAYGDDVQSRLDQGFKWLAVANDTGLFTTAVKQRLATART
ncbi:MAG TPA: aldolase/citrate lyase family protein [Chloroflexota bacterium]|nr:aldolase/citrate lyase family protein [Chloroflexota bacterium]